MIDTVALAVAPDIGRHNGFVTLVDLVAYGLANEMRTDRVALQFVRVEQVALAAKQEATA